MTAFRETESRDLPAVAAIIDQAKAFLKAQGIDQWQDGYPNEAVIREDMRLRNAYVYAPGGEPLAIATVVFTGEPTYDKIFEGAWTTPEPFACAHRIAVRADQRGLGTAEALMREVDALVRSRGMPSLRIDTHRGNLPMQKMLAKCGFRRCGVIYLAGGAERIALEKLV